MGADDGRCLRRVDECRCELAGLVHAEGAVEEVSLFLRQDHAAFGIGRTGRSGGCVIGSVRSCRVVPSL